MPCLPAPHDMQELHRKKARNARLELQTLHESRGLRHVYERGCLGLQKVQREEDGWPWRNVPCPLHVKFLLPSGVADHFRRRQFDFAMSYVAQPLPHCTHKSKSPSMCCRTAGFVRLSTRGACRHEVYPVGSMWLVKSYSNISKVTQIHLHNVWCPRTMWS